MPNVGLEAAKMTSPLERMKKLVVCSILQKLAGFGMKKPFNPILGETVNATIGDFNVYMEQICHHPPISNFQIDSEKHPEFSVDGSFEVRAYTSMNSIKGSILGPLNYNFKTDGAKVVMHNSANKVGSIMSSKKRTVRVIDSLTFQDE